MGIFDDILGKKDDKTPAAKPDFSNVSSGGSSAVSSSATAAHTRVGAMGQVPRSIEATGISRPLTGGKRRNSPALETPHRGRRY